jgi:hypothetical protein
VTLYASGLARDPDHSRRGGGLAASLLAGVVLTVLTVIGLAVSIPYWHMLGILAP